MDSDRNEIHLGDRVRESVTGFCGTVTGIADYLTGCSRACVQLGTDEKGAWQEARWFDVEQLAILEAHPVIYTVATARGGPAGSAPTKWDHRPQPISLGYRSGKGTLLHDE